MSSSRSNRVSLRPLFAGAVAAAALLVVPPAIAAPAADDPPPPQQRDFRFSPPRGNFGIRVGWALNRTDSDIYDFFNEQLTLEDSDYDHPVGAFDLGWRITDRVDAVLGVEFGRRSVVSEMRDFVTLDDLPIVQETRLSQTPVTLSLKFYLSSRGRRVGQYAWVPAGVVPYVGGGAGATYYKLEQFGDFVDFRDLTIFEDFFVSDGWTLAFHAFGGVDIKLTPSIGLVLEGRYHWADAELRDSFIGFDPIDLTGLRATAGVSFKF